MEKQYNIGLDIGTTSVGWAVVEADTQKIIRKGKGKARKSLWGVRLFEEAVSAEKEEMLEVPEEDMIEEDIELNY